MIGIFEVKGSLQLRPTTLAVLFAYLVTFSGTGRACVAEGIKSTVQRGDAIVQGTFVRGDWDATAGFGYIIPINVKKGPKRDRYEIRWNERVDKEESHDIAADCRPGIPKSGTLQTFVLQKASNDFYMLIGKYQTVEEK